MCVSSPCGSSLASCAGDQCARQGRQPVLALPRGAGVTAVVVGDDGVDVGPATTTTPDTDLSGCIRKLSLQRHADGGPRRQRREQRRLAADVPAAVAGAVGQRPTGRAEPSLGAGPVRDLSLTRSRACRRLPRPPCRARRPSAGWSRANRSRDRVGSGRAQRRHEQGQGLGPRVDALERRPRVVAAVAGVHAREGVRGRSPRQRPTGRPAAGTPRAPRPRAPRCAARADGRRADPSPARGRRRRHDGLGRPPHLPGHAPCSGSRSMPDAPRLPPPCARSARPALARRAETAWRPRPGVSPRDALARRASAALLLPPRLVQRDRSPGPGSVIWSFSHRRVCVAISRCFSCSSSRKIGARGSPRAARSRAAAAAPCRRSRCRATSFSRLWQLSKSSMPGPETLLRPGERRERGAHGRLQPGLRVEQLRVAERDVALRRQAEPSPDLGVPQSSIIVSTAPMGVVS